MTAALAALAASVAADGPLADDYDEAQLSAFIRRTQVEYGELELHRSNPIYHLGNLDLGSTTTATTRPRADRDQARRADAAASPAAIDGATQSLDRVSAPVARSLLDVVKGLTAGAARGRWTSRPWRLPWQRTPGWSSRLARPPAPATLILSSARPVSAC